MLLRVLGGLRFAKAQSVIALYQHHPIMHIIVFMLVISMSYIKPFPRGSVMERYH